MFLKKIKNTIKKNLKSKFKKSFSQSGEDMLLNTIFAGIKHGFYVDVGANDPFIQSNTQHFYSKGWRGINIDPNDECIRRLNQVRNRDTNIKALISDTNSELNYYYYKNPLYNGCINNPEIPSEILHIEKIKSRTLNSVLQQHNCINIDFLSIDTEGHELNVLRSLDLDKIRPKIILIESFNMDVITDIISEASLYLKRKNYVYLSRTVTNTLYISSEFMTSRFNK